MGRTHGALAQHNPIETLAQWLESLRQRSRMCWRQMAQTVVETGLSLSESTLYRAAQGKTVPKWKTVQAFTQVCGGDEREAKRLWGRADRYAAGRTDGGLRVVVVPPQFITEPWQLIHAMNHMRRENGNPTLRELEEKAYVDVENKVSLLPKSTVGAVLQGRMPAKDLLLNFVRHCGNVPEIQIQDWEDAWERANAYRKGELRPAAAQAQQELARVEEELKRAREQLEQATAELARTARPARREPTALLPPPRPAELTPSPVRPKKNALYCAGPPPQVKSRGKERRGARRPLRAS